MNDLRTAAQQALEALEYHVEQTRPIHRTSEAITALHAALAEPVQEPVQEPVAWQDTAKPTELVCAEHWENIDPVWHSMYRPLYAAPPQRKPLTQEEIAVEWRKASECAGKSEGAVTTSQFVEMFARGVEAKHGIKESP